MTEPAWLHTQGTTLPFKAGSLGILEGLQGLGPGYGLTHLPTPGAVRAAAALASLA